MAADPRKFLVAMCDEKGRVQRTNSQKKNEFFNQLGKIGDVELLNDLGGAGDVAKGLRTLAATSDSIRVNNDTALANRLAAEGTSAVYAATGINEGDIPRANNFNPGVVNRAQGQAEQIIDRVTAGNYNLDDIPNTYSDIQNLSSLIKGIYPGGASGGADEVTIACGASPFAMDLIRYAPKFKYLFIVQMQFNSPYNAWQGKFSDQLCFVVKHSTRPQVDIEHEEVNMYNFWTRIPKRTVYQPMTMRFYDDSANAATRFYDQYIKAISPIANLASTGEVLPEQLAANSMDRLIAIDDEFGFANQISGASLGKLAEGNINILKSIKLFHVYDAGRYMNVHTFYNPKILALIPDELSMAETGDGSEFEFQFAYDAMQTQTDYAIPEAGEYNAAVISTQSGLGNYPLTNNNIPPVPSPGGKGKTSAQDKNIIVETGEAITNAASGIIDAGTGLVSNAFSAVNNFAGSIFK